MLEPVKGDFKPTTELSDIKDSSKYSREESLEYNGAEMMVLSQPRRVCHLTVRELFMLKFVILTNKQVR